jgi:hypothetical protein
VVGGDIAPAAIEAARRKHPEIATSLFDIRTDPFPSLDAWHCRDCFFHLSFSDIRCALDRFMESGSRLALLTTHRARVLHNYDIATGGFRRLDLERPPFGFGKPLRYLADYRPGRDFPRFVGVWSREQLAGIDLDRIASTQVHEAISSTSHPPRHRSS